MPVMEKAQLSAIEALVAKLKEDPTLIYDPELAFFKDFVLSWGAKVPAAKAPSAPAPEAKAEPEPAAAKPADPPKPAESPKVEEEEEEEPEEPDEPEEPEEEDPARLPEDPEPYPDKGPADEVELTDEQMDAQGAAKSAAAEALEDGDLAKAVEKYTEAIKIGNATAMMYAKRGEILLKAKRPCACIQDCTAAIAINPDSGKAYRTRGKAHRFLGHWEEAHTDLCMGQKLDFDDATEDVQKFVAEKYKKISERKTRQRIKDEAKAKKQKEKDYKRRKAEAQRAYDEAKKAEAAGGDFGGGFPGMGGFPGGMGGFPGMPGGMGGMPGGMGGMPGGMGGMPGGMGGMPGGVDPSLLQGLMSDPEVAQAFSNPKVMAAMQEIMSNPAAMAKYQSDPEIMGVMTKLMGKMGGMGGMPGGMGGMPGGMGGMPGMPGGMGGMGGMPGGMGGMGSDSGPTVEEVPENGVDGVD